MVFSHGEVTKTIIIPLNDDDVFNEDKIFEVMLSEPTAGSSLGKSKCTIVTILNDDGKITLAIAPNSKYSSRLFSVNFASKLNIVDNVRFIVPSSTLSCSHIINFYTW